MGNLIDGWSRGQARCDGNGLMSRGEVSRDTRLERRAVVGSVGRNLTCRVMLQSPSDAYHNALPHRVQLPCLGKLREIILRRDFFFFEFIILLRSCQYAE